MGLADAFAYATPAAIFREHAALSAFENDGARDLRHRRLAGIDDAGYDALAPVQWPLPARTRRDGQRASSPTAASPRPTARPASSPSRRGRATRTSAGLPADAQHRPRPRPVAHHDPHRPRPRLSQHIAEPFVEIHPADAARLGIGDADLVRVVEHRMATCWSARWSPTRQRQGSVFVPMHWTDQFSASGRIDALAAPRRPIRSPASRR